MENYKWQKLSSSVEFHFVDLQMLVMLLIYQSGYSPDQICPNLLEMRFERFIVSAKMKKVSKENRIKWF